MDGDQSYNDLRESLPGYSQIQVFILEPEFAMFEGSKEVSSNITRSQTLKSDEVK